MKQKCPNILSSLSEKEFSKLFTLIFKNPTKVPDCDVWHCLDSSLSWTHELKHLTFNDCRSVIRHKRSERNNVSIFTHFPGSWDFKRLVYCDTSMLEVTNIFIKSIYVLQNNRQSQSIYPLQFKQDHDAVYPNFVRVVKRVAALVPRFWSSIKFQWFTSCDQVSLRLSVGQLHLGGLRTYLMEFYRMHPTRNL